MIQLEQKLNVTPEEFMYIVRNSVFETAKANGVSELSIEDVETGFVYYNKLQTTGGKETRMKNYVDCFVPEKQYSATVSSGESSYSLTYMVEEVAGGCVVTYTEADTYEKTLKKMNASIMGYIFGRSQKKKVKNMLCAMEDYILANRKDVAKKIKNLEGMEK